MKFSDPQESPEAADKPGRESIEKALRRIHRLLNIRSQAMARQYGLTGPQLMIMKILSKNKAISLGELAKRSSLSPGTVSGIVERLEKRNFIFRSRGSDDRRRVLVRPGPRGKQLLERVPDLLTQSDLKTFVNLPKRERDMILHAVDRIESLLKTPDTHGGH